MNGYEFTERGKIIVVVLVIALLIIPAAVIVSRVRNGTPPSDDPGHHIAQPTPEDSHPDDQEPVITESPPPDEPDNPDDPDDLQGGSDGEQGSFDPPVVPPDEHDDPDDPGDEEQPPEIGPVEINSSAGTMSFMYAPDIQSALDTDTITMLGEFITSPRNTRDSIILVEIPDLPTGEASALTSAITNAFSQHGVTRRDLTFETYQSDISDSSFEVMLSFIQTSSPK